MRRATARLVVSLLVVAAGVLPLGGLGRSGESASASASVALSDEVVFRRMVFPVQGAASYSNSWRDARDGGAREHAGTDLMGHKWQTLLSAVNGTVIWTRTDGNNMLSVKDVDGWTYTYIHINNDSFLTDDGANPADLRFYPGIQVGSKVTAGQPIAYMGDSGNAEHTAPHLHFELAKPDGTEVNPYWSLQLSQGKRVFDRCAFDGTPPRKPSPAAGPGFWTMTADAGIHAFGSAADLGSVAGKLLNRPAVSVVPTMSGNGYWMVASDGGVFTFGDAAFHGSTGDVTLNKPVVGLAPTPSGKGYWLVASDGGVFTFGDAAFFGSTGDVTLNKPVIGISPSPSGAGYWMVAADGGVFTFGDAGFLGSLGATGAAVVDLTPAPSGTGYWLLASDGSVFSFGSAGYHGGTNSFGLCKSPGGVDLEPTLTGKGYWVQTADGETYAFGDAPDHGSVKRRGTPTAPAIGLAASP